ncbi:MAG: hypothetical protein IMZ53_08495 [Thermoplasmata archaeon]|nr:hypothetical protein [Thermoplasmata archaeon]MBE3140608.1 hypothetical protein [Thermoplasmata archaeon]
MVEIFDEHIDYTSGIPISVRRDKILSLCRKHGKQKVVDALVDQEHYMWDLRLPRTEKKVMRDKIWLKKLDSC